MQVRVPEITEHSDEAVMPSKANGVAASCSSTDDRIRNDTRQILLDEDGNGDTTDSGFQTSDTL